MRLGASLNAAAALAAVMSAGGGFYHAAPSRPYYGSNPKPKPKRKRPHKGSKAAKKASRRKPG